MDPDRPAAPGAAPDAVVTPGPRVAPVVRDAVADDLPAIAAIFTHFTLRTTMTVGTQIRSPRDWRERFATSIVDGPYDLLVAERDGAVVGYVETQRFRPKPSYDSSVELSIYVAPGEGRGGVGSALYGALFPRLSAGGRVHRAYAVIALPNDPSVAFHLAHGFVHRGTLSEAAYKFGRYLDIGYYERAL